MSKGFKNVEPLPPKGAEPLLTKDTKPVGPVATGISLVRDANGWSVYYVTTQGDKVLKSQALCEGEPKNVAFEVVKLATIQKLFA